MNCPLLARHKLNGGLCDFPEMCKTPRNCFWARFHHIDPNTLKPLPPPHFELTPDGDYDGEETREDSRPAEQDLPVGQNQ